MSPQCCVSLLHQWVAVFSDCISDKVVSFSGTDDQTCNNQDTNTKKHAKTNPNTNKLALILKPAEKTLYRRAKAAGICENSCVCMSLWTAVLHSTACNSSDQSPCHHSRLWRGLLFLPLKFYCCGGIEMCMLLSSLPYSGRHLSCDDCSVDKREDYQNCSVLCCVWQMCTMICTYIWAVLKDEGLRLGLVFCAFV